MGELDGVRVLDLTRALAGPFCTMVLGDMGAEVIKVEMPGTGDDSRSWGPPFLEGESAYFLSINRNKKSVTLNLKAEEGLKILHGLAEKSDVFIENFRPGVTKKLRIDYETISEINPKIVYCSITGFGSEGPYRDRPGFDVIIQGMSGLMGVTGEEGRPPVKVGVAITDLIAGLYAVNAVLIGLLRQRRTGEGQLVDVSLLDSAASIMTHMAHICLAGGEAPPRLGSAHPQIAPYQAFEAKGGKYLTVGAANERLWRIFCEAAGLEELIDHPKFSVNAKRVENREELVKIIQERLLTKTRDEWLEIFQGAGLPCGPVYGLDEVFEDPQIAYRGMILEMDHPKAGKIKQIGIPTKFSKSPGSIRSPPPTLGQHTEEVLRDLLGFDRAKIEELRRAGVV